MARMEMGARTVACGSWLVGHGSYGNGGVLCAGSTGRDNFKRLLVVHGSWLVAHMEMGAHNTRPRTLDDPQGLR